MDILDYYLNLYIRLNNVVASLCFLLLLLFSLNFWDKQI
jgi:hypothetical protein